jgi:2-iminobutanoate/2-iminopropanoate deaminase
MKTIIETPHASTPIGPYSQAVRVGNLVFTSGCVALHPQTGELVMENIEAETERVMENLKAILEAAGVTFAHVAKTGIFLKNLDDFARVNAVYARYFEGQYPARETVQVARLPRDVNVEISMIAMVP